MIELLRRQNEEGVDQSAFDEDSDSDNSGKELASQQLQVIWSITLSFLSRLTTQELSDNQVLEELFNTFIMLDDQVKEGMFMNILNILQKIVQSNKNGSYLVRLVIATLQHTDISEDKHLNIAFMVCSTALKIILKGNYSNVRLTYDPTDSLYCEVDFSDVGELYQCASNLLINYLNIGSFEGSAGAKTRVVELMTLVFDMLQVVKLAKKNNILAFMQTLSDCQSNSTLKSIVEESINNSLIWLFLNQRGDEDNAQLQALGYGAVTTPAVVLTSRISDCLIQILMNIGSHAQNLESTKIALKSLTNIVMSLNKNILSRTETDRISFNQSITISKRTNQLFTKFAQQWLVSEETIQYFCFDLKGFNFLLDQVSREGSQSKAPKPD